MVDYSTVKYGLRIYPHFANGAVLDLTPYILQMTRRRAIDGGGAWVAVIKNPPTDLPEDALARQRLMTDVRDDDWVEVEIKDAPSGPSILQGMVDNVRHHWAVDPSTGSKVKVWTLRGRDWAKGMTDTRVRMSCVYTSEMNNTVKVAISNVPLTPGILASDELRALCPLTAGVNNDCKWVLCIGTGTENAGGDNYANAQRALRQMTINGDAAHFVVLRSGAVYAMCPVEAVNLYTGKATRLPAIDNNALIIAVEGANQTIESTHGTDDYGHNYNVCHQKPFLLQEPQLSALVGVLRWYQSDIAVTVGLTPVRLDRPEPFSLNDVGQTVTDKNTVGFYTPDGGVTEWRYDDSTMLDPFQEGGLIGRNEVHPTAGRPFWTDPWGDEQWLVLMAAIADAAKPQTKLVNTKRADTATIPKMPGFIHLTEWHKVLEVLKTAYDPDRSGEQTSKSLRQLMTLMMRGLWTHPVGGVPLIGRMNWDRWDHIPGVPWKLLQGMASTEFASPDAVLRQFCCTAFNELFYDYADNGAPAIVFRERPYSGKNYKKLPVLDLTRGYDMEFDVSRSGDERFTYWHSSPVSSLLHGITMVVDFNGGMLPLIDSDDLGRHGLRVADPSDDLFPPVRKQMEPLLKWYIDRAAQFREWYKLNPEYLTGQVTIKPAVAGLKIGQRIHLPLEWEYQMSGGGTFHTNNIEGYVVAVEDTVNVDTRSGSATTTSTLLFIRGQPAQPFGLVPPASNPWKKPTGGAA